MKLLTGTVFAAAMFAAMPAFADRGDHDRGHGRGHDRDKHHWKQGHRGHHYYEPPRVEYREVVRHHSYYTPAPVYYAQPHYAQPSAGIHIMLPNIYIPIR